jgi:hypothetical protein
MKNEKLDVYIKGFQNTVYRRGRQIFQFLCNELDPGSKEIDLDQLRVFLYIHKTKANLNDPILKLICSYHLPEKLLKNEVSDSTYNLKLNEEQFCNFICGRELKSVLFEENIDQKRKHIEEITNLYFLLGGDIQGLSKQKLSSKISRVMKLYYNPEVYFEETYEPNDEKDVYQGEAGEIIDQLSTDSNEKLSLKDFINLMTAEFLSDFDLISLEN